MAPDEVQFEFTADGKKRFEELADSGKYSLADEACVIGTEERLKSPINSIQVRKAKSLYYQRYKESWKNFLKQCM